MAERKRRGRRGNGEGGIDLKPRSDGLWRARITLEDGTRMLYGRTREAVEEKLTAERRAKANGELVTSGKVPYSRWLEQWLVDLVEPSVAITTYERYRGIVHRHVEPKLGRYALNKLQPVHIQRAYRELRDDGLAPATINLIHVVIHRSLRDAKAMRLIGTNPAVDVAKPAERDRDATDHAFTPEQLVVLDQAIVGHTHEWLWRTLLETGIRIGEAAALRWQDVDLDGRRIIIRHSYRRTLSGPILSTPKTKRGRRTIPLSQAAYDALVQQQEQVRVQRKDAALWTTDGLVFPNSLGRPLRADKVLAEFKKVLVKNGLPPKRLHDLRHTFATRLYAVDANPRVVQELMGHARIEMTMDLYTGSVPSVLAEAVGRLDRRAPKAQSEATLG
ncbi:MAG TPA: site-specific integrase [Chloroflexota bacterium]|jgi:integrase